MAERRKRARDSDAAEALSKHPCIEGENEYDGESLNGGDTSSSRADDDPTLSGGDASSRAESDDNPANSAGLVSQLQQEIATVRCENSKLEAENKELQQKTHELSLPG